jgi:TPR repeat protein
MERGRLTGCALAIGLVTLSGCMVPAEVPVSRTQVAAPPPFAPAPVAVLDAEYRLARHYDQGDTVPQNFATAVYWYYHAAERGYAPAQLALAQCYTRGHGIPRDPILAYMWANLAASQMTRETPVGDFAQGYRDFTRYRLTTPEMLEAQQMATAWRPIGGAAP